MNKNILLAIAAIVGVMGIILMVCIFATTGHLLEAIIATVVLLGISAAPEGK